MKSKKNNFNFDFTVSLILFYIIKKLPFKLCFKVGKEKDILVDIKKLAAVLLDHGKGSNIDLDSKDAELSFKII